MLELTGDAPVLVSHAACRAVHDHPRNLADTQLRALAARGGVLGLMLHPLTIDPAAPTIERVCAHLEHAVEVMGVEAVALGGDFMARLARELPPAPQPVDALAPPGMAPGAAVDGLAGPEDYPALVSALRDRGWREGDLRRVLSANLIGFLRRSLPG